MAAVESVLAFVAAASVLTLTPGLDTALVLRSALNGGSRSGAFAAIGIVIGCLAWGAAAALGVGVLLAASGLAFLILKMVGAAYLFWAGSKLILKPRQQFELGTSQGDAKVAADYLRRGFWTNLLNPKVGLFYVSFLPQFVPAGVSATGFMLLLAATHGVLGLIWFTILIRATLPVRKFLRTGSVVKAMDRATGAIFLLFGARLALAQR